MRAATKFTMKDLAEVLVAACQRVNCSFAVDVFAALSALSFVLGNGKDALPAATGATR